MLSNPSSKYRPFGNPVDLPDRTWPSRTISAPPRWVSTDLRDGNQALVDPMDAEKKLRFFKLVVGIGFKEVEVGFPSASQTDFNFIRTLVEGGHIPDDVAVQVLTQSRRDLIERTFESLKGARQAIVHLYNATSPAFRRVVFQMERREIIELAISGARQMVDEAQKYPNTDWTFQYSPETFSTTEPEFALEICEAVIEIWQPTPDRKMIINLPATVEAATPNVYADQIEWFCRKVSRRDSVAISVHTHNDRGTGVAATELGIMAGADRVEGCLFGNGERTGNVDIVTLALNLYSQGIHPNLDFSDMRSIVKAVEYCNQLPVHPRHPYAGELVFTAFSGSHQDAIKKGFAARKARNDDLWEVPYLAIDPADIGSTYEAVIRVNSQSGKGGVAWILQQDQGLQLPRRLQIDFSRKVQEVTDTTSREMTAAEIWEVFSKAYYIEDRSDQRFQLIEYTTASQSRPGRDRRFNGQVLMDGVERPISGTGDGLVSSVLSALSVDCGMDLEVIDYHEHALRPGADSQAAAYFECRTKDGRTIFGVGIDADVATASVKAILSAANVASEKLGG